MPLFIPLHYNITETKGKMYTIQIIQSKLFFFHVVLFNHMRIFSKINIETFAISKTLPVMFYLPEPVMISLGIAVTYCVGTIRLKSWKFISKLMH